MYINDLPNDIKALAIINLKNFLAKIGKEGSFEYFINNANLIGAFNWKFANEPPEFWGYVYL